MITAGVLTGQSDGDASLTGNNDIGTLAGFTSHGDFSLTDTTALTITGTLDAADHTVTLQDTGGGIDASRGAILADSLTGSSTGDAVFSDSGNTISTLAGFTNTNGAFVLTDSAALTITGTLDATGHTVTLQDTGGGIDASRGAILADGLTGSSMGDAIFSDSGNTISTLAGFTNTNGAFVLTDSAALMITGTLDATGHAVTLTDNGGSIDASGGIILADNLSGELHGDADFSNANNLIGSLGDFTTNGHDFTLVTKTLPQSALGEKNVLRIEGNVDAGAGSVNITAEDGGILIVNDAVPGAEGRIEAGESVTLTAADRILWAPASSLLGSPASMVRL